MGEVSAPEAVAVDLKADVAHVAVHSGPKRQVDMFCVFALIAQAVLAVLFGLFTTYGEDVYNSSVSNVSKYHNFMIDVSTMIFVGFGFLMVNSAVVIAVT